MKKWILGFLTLAFICPLQANITYRVDNLPASVVETFPKSGDVSVDPSVNEIKVTFSKDMIKNNMWSWVIFTKDTFPQITGQVKYIDDRTCVAPVKLESGKTYAIWFNSENHQNFRDLQNHSSIPYLLVFQTK